MNKRPKDVEDRVRTFLRQYARQGPSKADANDRQYDRKVQALVKRMDPLELAAVLGQLDEDADEPEDQPDDTALS